MESRDCPGVTVGAERGEKGPEGGPPSLAGAQTHWAPVNYTLIRTASGWNRGLSRADGPATLRQTGEDDRHPAALGAERSPQLPQMFGGDGPAIL